MESKDLSTYMLLHMYEGEARGSRDTDQYGP